MKQIAELIQSLTDTDELVLLNKIRSMDYKRFLETNYWHIINNVVISKFDHRCALCNYNEKLVAHHRTYDNHGREHKFITDLTCLCNNCHYFYHKRRKGFIENKLEEEKIDNMKYKKLKLNNNLREKPSNKPKGMARAKESTYNLLYKSINGLD